jgi:restriction endonuclease
MCQSADNIGSLINVYLVKYHCHVVQRNSATVNHCANVTVISDTGTGSKTMVYTRFVGYMAQRKKGLNRLFSISKLEARDWIQF